MASCQHSPVLCVYAAAQTGAPTETYAHFFELWSVAPLFESGWAILGELPKFVRVSPRRFLWANSTADSMSFSVTGATGESVVIHVVAPASIPFVRIVNVTFPATRAVVVLCSGFGVAAECVVE